MLLGFADSSPAAPAPPDPQGQEPIASVGDEVNDVATALMPWAISVLFHAGLILLAVFAIWSAALPEDDQETIVPILQLSATPGSPLQLREQHRQLSQTQSRQLQRQTEARPDPLNRPDPMEMPTIGVANGSGPASPFASEDTDAAMTSTQFMGLEAGNVRKVAFVIDAGGSVTAEFFIILRELIRSVEQLSDRQQFTIIFFQGDNAIEVPPRGWKQATAQNRQHVIDWLDPSSDNITPRRNSNPVPAIELALRYRPDLIYLLSDDITGQGPYGIDQRLLLDRIRQANTAPTRIATIQFIYRDRLTDLGLKGTMQLIADQNDGEHRFISKQEVGLAD